MTSTGGSLAPLNEPSLRAVLARLSEQGVQLTSEAQHEFDRIIRDGTTRLREQLRIEDDPEALADLARVVDAVADEARTQGMSIVTVEAVWAVLRWICPIPPWC